MPGSVADASVLAAMFFLEPRRAEAAGLLSEATLYEPPLLAFEMASVARKKIRQQPGLSDGLLRALRTALAADIQWIDLDQVEVVRLALQTGLTTYDASYLYLARSLRVPLLTFDERLASTLS